ncbi:MAG: DUF2905 domain-containing protein [Deltaproteobacteria bacterium]|nr:DUF2905 domain-containing protein [Deltaproteobacteria bacterium]
MQDLGRLLIIIAVMTGIAGILLFYYDKIPFLGKLPGDIIIRKKNFTFYFPLATSVILSIIISLIISLFKR